MELSASWPLTCVNESMDGERNDFSGHLGLLQKSRLAIRTHNPENRPRLSSLNPMGQTCLLESECPSRFRDDGASRAFNH